MPLSLAIAIGSSLMAVFVAVGLVLLLKRRRGPVLPKPPHASVAAPVPVALQHVNTPDHDRDVFPATPAYSARAATRQPSHRNETGRTFSRPPHSFFDDVDLHDPDASRPFGDFGDDDSERSKSIDPPAADHGRAHANAETNANDYFSYAPPWLKDTSTSFNDSHTCPHCGSSRVEVLNIGRKAGTTIGSVAGATSGVAMALSGAEAGAAVGAIGGPLGAVFGGLTGAVLAGLLGSAAGSIAGSTIGGALDDNFLDNFRCQSCGQSFGAQFH